MKKTEKQKIKDFSDKARKLEKAKEANEKAFVKAIGRYKVKNKFKVSSKAKVTWTIDMAIVEYDYKADDMMLLYYCIPFPYNIRARRFRQEEIDKMVTV